MSEEWRTIPSLPAYSVSSLGRVRRDVPSKFTPRSGNFISPRLLPQGHLIVTLSMGGVRRDRLVHRLVAEAFLAPPDEGMDCVLHGDDDPSNNCPENLRWGNRTENANQRVARNRCARGERAGPARLLPADVVKIRERFSRGEMQRDIARDFGISQSNVSLIIQRQTWAHIP